jgi:hypothetical protein
VVFGLDFVDFLQLNADFFLALFLSDMRHSACWRRRRKDPGLPCPREDNVATQSPAKKVR